VLAYNPKTHRMELEPVVRVWINHDSDLVDLTVATSTHAPHSTVVQKHSEVLHTNQRHPFLTLEKGFVPVSQITLGMHVLNAHGSVGVVTGWKAVAGTQVMYNLEVAQDHTYTVGAGEWGCTIATRLLKRFGMKETLIHLLSRHNITLTNMV
jgi:hypothetical protein